MGKLFAKYVLSVFALLVTANLIFAQTEFIPEIKGEGIIPSNLETKTTSRPKSLIISVLPNYFDENDGISLDDLIKRTWENNGALKIAGFELEKAKARLTQSGLRRNPTLEVEQTSGRLVGSGGDGELSVGIAVPLDIYKQRQRRIDSANAEITLREAEFVALQRRLANDVLVSYAEALALLRELKTLEEILELDTETVRFVQIRVNEGETAPLELNLLQTEIERLRSRRFLTEGKLQAALSKLKFYAFVPHHEALKLREEIYTAKLPETPNIGEPAIAEALKNRPELRVIQLEEDLAAAGLRLIYSQSRPEVSAYTRYTQGRSVIGDPNGAFAERNRSLTFGVSIGLPVFDKNQGAKAEAEIAVRQIQAKRNFAEQIIKNEIITAFQRLQAANSALATLETAVLPRSKQNLETFRQIYEIGELKITDLIAEQRRLLEANRDLTETLTERYRAKADLLIALGVSPINK